MQDKLTLMIPGPTPVPETVLQAMGRHPIGHRSADFQKIVKRTTEQLQGLHQTTNDVLVITGSGTAAMEAGIINTLSRGDRVLCGDNGKFGERWVKVAKAYGLDVQVIKAEWGQPLDPEAFRAALEADGAKANGAKAMRALQESVRQLEGPATQLNDQISKGTARMSELGQEVAVLLRKARESSASAGLALVEEASGIKAEARSLSRKTAENQIAADSMMSESRLVSAQLREAQGLQAAATAALDLMNGFEADIDGQAAKCRELASELRRSADTLMKSIADERAGGLNAAYEAAATDLANAAADADSDALRHTLTCEELRMHVTRITGLGAQGRRRAARQRQRPFLRPVAPQREPGVPLRPCRAPARGT